MSNRQRIIAIKARMLLGKKIAREYPQVADLCGEGKTYKEAALALDLDNVYGVSIDVARDGVEMALRGSNSGDGETDFEGLLTREERYVITKRQRRRVGFYAHFEGKGVHALSSEELSEAGERGGTTTLARKVGIYGLSGKKRYENSQRGGRRAHELKKGAHGLSARERKRNARKASRMQSREDKCRAGDRSYQLGKGIHGLSEEQKREARRKGLIARGLVPWSGEEQDELYRMSLLDEFKYDSGNNREMSRLSKIAKKINDIYHKGEDVRTKRAVSKILIRMRRGRQNEKVGENSAGT